VRLKEEVDAGLKLLRQNGISWSVTVVSSEPLSAGSRWPFPRLSTFPAFEINARTFVQILADDFCPPTEGLHGKPLRVFLQFATLSFHRSVVATENCAMAVPCWLYFTSGSRPRFPINITFCILLLLLFLFCGFTHNVRMAGQ
jgi:hypothetical protein